MYKLLAFWGSILWIGLECWIMCPASRKARIAEIITGVVYMVVGSIVIAMSESPLEALVASFFALLGVFHVSGASSEELAPWDSGVDF